MTCSAKKIILCTAIIFISFGLMACSSAIPKFSNSKTASKIPINQTFDSQNYNILQAADQFTPVIKDEIFKKGDIAKISVNGLKEFSGTYTVGKDGKIYFGHIGDVFVEGLTVPEVQLKVRKGYNTCCLTNPNVSVEREDKQPIFGKIVVDGAVNDSGLFEIDEFIRLSEALALAGGMSELADPKMTVISRVVEGERKVSNVNMNDIQLYGAIDPLIFPNDVIFIQDSSGRLLYQDFVKTLPLVSAVIFAATR